jgi:uncharacterized iron-regulated membrane protein
MTARERMRIRSAHHGLGLLAAFGAVLLIVTGLALQHPSWWGRSAEPPTVAAADPGAEGRLLRAAPFLLEESLDGGATWRDLPAMLAPAHPVALVFAPASVGTVWLLGGLELAVSSDGGRVWSAVDLPLQVTRDNPALDLAVTPAGEPLVVSRTGAWHRRGDTWVEAWSAPAQRGDGIRTWLHRLHTGRWGPAWVVRLYDLGAFVGLLVVVTGLVLVRRRRRRGSRAS